MKELRENVGSWRGKIRADMRVRIRLNEDKQGLGHLANDMIFQTRKNRFWFEDSFDGKCTTYDGGGTRLKR